MQALVGLIHRLQDQVEGLNQQLKAVQSEQRAEREQNERLLNELQAVKKQLTAVTLLTQSVSVGTSGALPSGVSESPEFNSEQETSYGERVARIEETQQLTDRKLQDLSQTKVESNSNYRLRLSGIALLNLSSTRGSVDYLDTPEIATERAPMASDGAFGGSLRQSQIGLEGFGPEIWGAKTSASVKFDFAGGFPGAPNGITQGIARLRTGVIRLDWDNTSLIAGQDALFLSPISPTSLASLAVPALAYSGNLWSWAPQVRAEHRIQVTDSSKLLLQGAVMDNLSGEVPNSGYGTKGNASPGPTPIQEPSAGESSGQPAYAARIAWTNQLWGQAMTIGAGGYYSRQNWGFDRTIDAWAGTTDLAMPLGSVVEFDAEFYRGRALGGLAGGIGQSVLWREPLQNATTSIYGLDSIGGWAQLKFKLTPKFELNGAYGQDNPYASELRTFGGNAGYYNGILSKNTTTLANLIYQPRSDVVMSIEYRYLKTFPLDSYANTANHMSLSLGYIF
jgi:hypothetical protein